MDSDTFVVIDVRKTSRRKASSFQLDTDIAEVIAIK